MGKKVEQDNFEPTLASKIIVSIIFVAVLIIPIAMQMDVTAPSEKKDNSAAKEYALDVFGFYLEDIKPTSGIDFEHKAPQLDPQLDHILPTIASVGASVSIVDVNNDGWQDIYLTASRSGNSNALYVNKGDGSFEDKADAMGIGAINSEEEGVSMGAVWADVDNDGFEDLFVYKWGKPQLFLNIEGERFKDITDASGLPNWINSNAAIWFDYNNDGLIDLFVGGYYKESINLWDLDNTLIMPESFEYATNGGTNYLMENLGNGQFRDVTGLRGFGSTRWTLAIGAMDFDGNGYQDLFIANDYSVDELYLNYGEEGFKEVGKAANIGYAPKSGMNVSIADVKNDGNFSVYVSNITEMGILLQGNNMWVSSLEGDKVSFSNRAGAMGIELGGWSYGAQFGDLNNDGYQDLYLANGYISAAQNNSYWYDYSKVTGGNKAIISDALNWPAMEGRSQSGYQHNKVWVNSSAGIFADVTDYVADIPPYDSRAVALADLDNNGSLDVVVANQGKEVSVLHNSIVADRNWIAFQLEGTKSNRSAVGAKVTLTWEGERQTQVLYGGIGFSSQNQRALHFGLGQSDKIESVLIEWPSGAVDELPSMEINKTHKIVEANENS